MSPEEKELLRRSIALSEENNDMLRSIQRWMRLSRVFSVLYWLFIIGTALGAYYFAQPYIAQLSTVYGSARNNINEVNAFFGSFNSTDKK